MSGSPGGLIDRVGILRPLRIRDFRLLWTGMFVSMAGDGIYFKSSPAADNGFVSNVYVHSFWPNGNAGVRTAAPNTTIPNSFFTGGTSVGIPVDTGCTLATIEHSTLGGDPSSRSGVACRAPQVLADVKRLIPLPPEILAATAEQAAARAGRDDLIDPVRGVRVVRVLG